jgi:hypothetical protein
VRRQCPRWFVRIGLRSSVCGCRLMVRPRVSAPMMRVRFTSPAPKMWCGIFGRNLIYSLPNMKTCSKCHRVLPLNCYSFVHPAKMDGRLRPDCKECVRNRSRASYNVNPEPTRIRHRKLREKATLAAKELVAAYLLSHPCVACGESDPIVLEFDHVRGVKTANVALMVSRGYRLWRVQAEIAKCEVRCANCHRRVTHQRRKRAQNNVTIA